MQSSLLTRNRVLAAVSIVGVLLISLQILHFYKLEQRQRLEIPLEWARLAPYPESAMDLSATTSGSMFTRAFRVTFIAPAPDIEQWLVNSPGIGDAKVEVPSPGKRCYVIKPGGGAQHAEVTVDDAVGLVSIYVYWS